MTAPLATILQDALGRDYRIEHELDGGGMSRLFVATEMRLGRRVVIKVLPPEFVSDEATARFRREIELTVRLQHPHILPVLTSGACDELLWYTTPYIAGESLRVRLQREPKLPLDEIIKILRDVSGALAFAHARGIVHRDIKPGNILLAEGHAILADFGIARAVGTSGPRLTGSGMMVGTPGYMAPELPTEESADVFALGVVACEMLCGALPRRGVTAKELVAQRGDVLGDRRSTTHALARLIATAVSEAPNQRLASATIALDQIQALLRPERSWRGTLYATIAVVCVIGALVLAWVHFGTPRLDTDKYVLTATASSPELRGEIRSGYTAALNEWDGAKVTETGSADASRGGVTSSDAAIAEARRYHARNAIVAAAEAVGDSVVVRATMYDANADTAVRSTRVAFRMADGSARTMAIRRSVNGLLRTGTELPWSSATDHTRPSLAAWRDYDAGRTALLRWDLPAAQSAFRSAIAAASAMPLAHLWLAQVLALTASRVTRIESRAELGAEARRALDARSVLTRVDSIRAVTLLSLADAGFQTRCSDVESLVRRDSSDVIAWVDLGDCRAADDIVVPNPRARTGWAFESSYEAAAAAYHRAGDLGPAASDSPFQGWLLGRLSDVLYTAPNHIRQGYRVDRDTLHFAAFPALSHDTVAFEPFPMAELSSGRMQPPPDATQGAMLRNRALLRRAAEDWVRRAPRSAAAYDSLAAWAEVSGGIATIDERTVPVLEVVRRARQLATDPTERLHLAVADVRLLVKNDSFALARVEAESLLAAGAGSHVPYVAGVDGLALLVGKPAEAARIRARSPDTRIATPHGSVVQLPGQLVETDARLVAYTSLGLRNDTVASVVRQTETLIDSYFPDLASAADVRSAIFTRPLIAAYPMRSDLLRQVADTNDLIAAGYARLIAGDTVGARSMYSKEVAVIQGQMQGTSIDGTYRRASLALLLRDSTDAINQLDPVLRALPTLAPTLLSEPAQIGALLRSLVLRAHLASHRGDGPTVRQCAHAVSELWKDADPELRTVAREMVRLSL